MPFSVICKMWQKSRTERQVHCDSIDMAADYYVNENVKMNVGSVCFIMVFAPFSEGQSCTHWTMRNLQDQPFDLWRVMCILTVDGRLAYLSNLVSEECAREELQYIRTHPLEGKAHDE